jgi:hypothetical protein
MKGYRELLLVKILYSDKQVLLEHQVEQKVIYGLIMMMEIKYMFGELEMHGLLQLIQLMIKLKQLTVHLHL